MESLEFSKEHTPTGPVKETPSVEFVKMLDRIKEGARRTLSEDYYKDMVEGREEEVEKLIEQIASENESLWKASMPEVEQAEIENAEELRIKDLVRKTIEKLGEMTN